MAEYDDNDLGSILTLPSKFLIFDFSILGIFRGLFNPSDESESKLCGIIFPHILKKFYWQINFNQILAQRQPNLGKMLLLLDVAFGR